MSIPSKERLERIACAIYGEDTLARLGADVQFRMLAVAAKAYDAAVNPVTISAVAHQDVQPPQR